MKNTHSVTVIPYDIKWPEFYRQEALRVQSALDHHLLEAYHIGSTAIPGMVAKPVIDMLLVCENLDFIDDIKEKLKTIDYIDVSRHIIPHRSFFTRRQEGKISYHLHIRERGDPQIKRHVNFRDYVIAHPDAAHQYEELKLQLAEKYKHDRYQYVFGKDKLVQQIDAKAKLWPGRKRDYLPPNTGPRANEWSQEKLIKAMEANLNVQNTHFSQYLNQVELVRVPGFTIVNANLPDDIFNVVLEADFSQAEADKKILEVSDYIRQKKAPFFWLVSPYDRPRDIPKYLEENGYVNSENNMAMYFDLDAWDGHFTSVPQIEIIQAKDEKSLQDFAKIWAMYHPAFKEYTSWIAPILTEDDPFEYYVGYANGKPVVRALSCYFGQLSGLYWLSTAPDERKKGYGRAIQQHRLRRAKELGYHIDVLEASSQGYALYKNLGYKEFAVFREFKLANTVKPMS